MKYFFRFEEDNIGIITNLTQTQIKGNIMKIKDSIKIEILAAATALLQTAIPELNAENLLDALKSYNPYKSKVDDRPKKRTYTVKEAMEIFQLSKPSIFKLINRGDLVRIRILGATRLTNESISRLLEGER